MREQHGLAGRVWISLTDPQTGEVVEERFINNHIVSSGRILLAQLFANEATLSGLKIVIGTGQERDKDSAVQLKDIKDVDGKAATATLLTDTVNEQGQAIVSVEATFSAQSGQQNDTALTEAGIVLVSDGGKETLYNRVTFPVITRTANLDMTFRWEVIF